MAAVKNRNPGNFSTEIHHTAECAFQRAIILGKTSFVNGEIIKWIDIELPVDGIKARGKCIDLIGIDSKGNYVICELKFRRNYHDNGGPIEAAEQLIEYYKYIKTNKDQLIGLQHKNATEPIDWYSIASNKTRLFVVANKDYFNSWYVRKKSTLNKDVEYYSVNIEQDVFQQQKGFNPKYTPWLSCDIEWKKLL